MDFTFKTDANGDPFDILMDGDGLDLFCDESIPIKDFLTFYNTVTLVLSQVDFPPNGTFLGTLGFGAKPTLSHVYIGSVKNATSYIEKACILAPKKQKQ